MTHQTDSISPSAGESNEAQLCAGCLHQNTLEAHFCAKCGAPLTSYATTGPMESIWAEGYMYRSAVDRPRNLVVVLGVWMLGLAAASFGMVILTGSLKTPDNLSWLGTLAGAVVVVWALVLVTKTTRNYFAARKGSAGCAV